MEKVIDIRPLKKKLRAEAREMRRAMSPDRKQSLDRKIKNKLLNLWSVREAKAVLCYVSTDIEVDTREFINALLATGKRVAVPRCEGEKSNMNFYYINSLDELDVGSFGVDEPDPAKHIMVGDTKDIFAGGCPHGSCHRPFAHGRNLPQAQRLCVPPSG